MRSAAATAAVVTAALALMALAACGSPGVASPGRSTTTAGSVHASPPPSPPPTSKAPPEAFAQASQRPLPTIATAPPGSVGDRWTFWGTTDGGRRVVLDSVVGGGCVTFRGVTVTERAAVVTISPRSTVSRPTERACPANLVLLSGYVTLSAPLGGRSLSQGTPTYP